LEYAQAAIYLEEFLFLLMVHIRHKRGDRIIFLIAG